MPTIIRGVSASLIAVTLWAHAAGAQTVVIDDRPVQEHFTFEATTYVSLEVLLRALRFDWSLSGRDLVLRAGSGQGPRIAAEDVSIKLGDRTIDISGIQRRGTTYVPLLAVVPHLGYRAVHDARANTLTVVAAGETPAQRVRIGRQVGDRSPEPGRAERTAADPAEGVRVRQPARAVAPAERPEAGAIGTATAFTESCDVADPHNLRWAADPAAILAGLRHLVDPGDLPRGRQVTMSDVTRLMTDRLHFPLAARTPEERGARIRVRQPAGAAATGLAAMFEQPAAQVDMPAPVHMVEQLVLPGGYFYSRKGNAAISLARAHTHWRKTWHAIVPGRFQFTPGTDLLFYDRLTGEAGVYGNDGKGNFSLLKGYTGWRKTWDIIVPGRFSDGVHAAFTDLFLYDRQNREATFYRTDGNGNVDLLKHHTGMQDWDVIVSGDWGGSAHTDLFFYSRTRGEARFYRTDGKGNLQLLKSHNMKRSWDVIVPGRFGGADRTDLLFYRRIIGDAQVYAVDANGNMSLMREHTGWRTTWDVIVPGEFGGSGRTDLFMYDRRAGVAAFAHGGAQGAISMQPLQTGLRSTWFSIVPGEFGFTSGTDLLFYDNHYRIPIQAIRVADTDGLRAAAVTPAQVGLWVDRANQVFADAGIVFTFDPATDWQEKNYTLLNDLGTVKDYLDMGLDTLTATEASDATKAVANFLGNWYPGKIVVIFRHGPDEGATGGGFSYFNASYAAMPGFWPTGSTMYYQDPTHPQHGKNLQGIKLLAHELGHYLGLPHTFPVQLDDRNEDGVVDEKDLADWLKGKSGSLSVLLDGDRDVVFDTPPDVGRHIFVDAGLNPADRDGELPVAWSGQSLTLSPDRHNVMTYGSYDDYQRLSPDQVRRVREWLHGDQRKHLIAGQ